MINLKRIFVMFIALFTIVQLWDGNKVYADNEKGNNIEKFMDDFFDKGMDK